MAEFKVEGLEELMKKLGNFEDKIVKKAVGGGLERASAPLQEEVAKEAPVHSGLTRRSVKITKAKLKNGYVFTNVRIGDSDFLFQGKGFYVGFIIYGFTRNGIIYPPNDFISRAFMRKYQQVADDAIDMINEAIEEITS